MKRLSSYDDRKKNLAHRMLALSKLDPSLYEEMLSILPEELSQQVQERIEGMSILMENHPPMKTLQQASEKANG